MAVIKPGGMGSNADPNTKPSVFDGSMADAMESALNKLLSNEGMKTFKVDTNSREARDRRRLFVAIAQGIVRHLTDRAGALVIKDSLNNVVPERIDIKADNTLL
jgi:hypothetical protein